MSVPADEAATTFQRLVLFVGREPSDIEVIIAVVARPKIQVKWTLSRRTAQKAMEPNVNV